jgi:hypothetical protein
MKALLLKVTLLKEIRTFHSIFNTKVLNYCYISKHWRSWAQKHMLVIPATWEAEIGRIAV